MEALKLAIQALIEENQALRQENAALRARIAELEKRLGLNSQNSSKPPSTDGFNKPNKQSSLRGKGKNPSGGQNGHKGYTLVQVAKPDKIERHQAVMCPHCQSQLDSDVIGISKRQVFDIPPQQIEVTEHQAEIKICPCCHKKVRAEFPSGVDSPTQYGEKIKSLSAYLNTQQFIPEDRIQIFFRDLYNVQIATATIVKFCNDLSNKLEPFNQALFREIKKSLLNHLDETGYKISGKTQWLHVASNEKFTYYHSSPKRKSLLKKLKGTVVHDHFKPYYQLPEVKHALCNAHHLRELEALVEYDKERWAKKMKKLLIFMCNYRKHFTEKIPNEKLDCLEKIYRKILDEGFVHHIKRRENLIHGGMFLRKRYPGHNLLLRLEKYQSDTLRFLHDPMVPFTNNQAERDLRMMKLRQKISGGFRTEKGAETFVRIRSFISTARKQGWDIFASISGAVNGVLPKLSN